MKIRRSISIIAIFLISFSVFTFAAMNSVIGVTRPSFLHSLELPLGKINGIAVDSDGNIYVGSSAYARIQIYDKHGQFVRGFFIPEMGGWFDFSLERDGVIYVETARGNRAIELSYNGEVIYEEKSIPEDELRLQSKLGQQSAVGPYGTQYHAIESWVFPTYVTTLDSSGKERYYFRQSWLLWLTKAPWPSGMFFIIGMILAFSIILSRNNVVVVSKNSIDGKNE